MEMEQMMALLFAEISVDVKGMKADLETIQEMMDPDKGKMAGG
jgi:hypothetical protein